MQNRAAHRRGVVNNQREGEVRAAAGAERRGGTHAERSQQRGRVVGLLLRRGRDPTGGAGTAPVAAPVIRAPDHGRRQDRFALGRRRCDTLRRRTPSEARRGCSPGVTVTAALDPKTGVARPATWVLAYNASPELSAGRPSRADRALRTAVGQGPARVRIHSPQDWRAPRRLGRRSAPSAQTRPNSPQTGRIAHPRQLRRIPMLSRENPAFVGPGALASGARGRRFKSCRARG